MAVIFQERRMGSSVPPAAVSLTLPRPRLDDPRGGTLMGPLGVPELLFILVLALLIFGPKRLPEIGRTLGRGMSEFRKASNELKRSINTELALDEAPTPPAASPSLRSRLDPAVPAAAPAMTAARGSQPAEPTVPDITVAETVEAPEADLAP